jgi:uncharacterized membrane protein YfcA
MIWALLAAFLRNRPPWVQAAMFGMCTGLFVAAGTSGVQRIADIDPSRLLVLVVAAFTASTFYVAMRAHLSNRSRGQERAGRVHGTCAAVWLLLLVAALRALLGAGGYRVAVFAIVPIVLLAPPALVGLRALTTRRTDLTPSFRKRRRARPQTATGSEPEGQALGAPAARPFGVVGK